MLRIILLLILPLVLTACENMYQDDGVPRIRSQRDVEAYNATVSSEAEKLVCTREFVVGSNVRSFQCMTVRQRDRLARETQEVLDATRGG